MTGINQSSTASSWIYPKRGRARESRSLPSIDHYVTMVFFGEFNAVDLTDTAIIPTQKK